MRIGIDFHSAEREGTGNCSYIRNLVEAMLAADRKSDFFLYVSDSNCPYYARFRGRPHVHLRRLWSRTALARLVSLGFRARRDKLDLLHVQFIAPPLFFNSRLIVTVHDLAYADCPECFSFLKRAYLRTLVPLSLRRASRVLTVSDFSRRAIAARYPFCEDKIHVYPLAAKPSLGRGKKRERGQLERIGIRNDFILYAGRLDARKNIPALLQAFSLLKKGRGVPHQLVVTGPKEYWPRALERELTGNEFRSDIVRTGVVDEDLLADLYSSADVFVYPSLYEGFGLPVLEAMSSGCPVVSTDTSSIPEVVADAGLLVWPPTPELLAEAILRVLADKRLRADLIRKGLARARSFSWSETARNTLAVYRQTSGSPD